MALIATAAEFAGPVLAAGIGVTLLRLATGHLLSPLAGAFEAGALATATWWAFEA
jgi:hypothetical protein